MSIDALSPAISSGDVQEVVEVPESKSYSELLFDLAEKVKHYAKKVWARVELGAQNMDRVVDELVLKEIKILLSEELKSPKAAGRFLFTALLALPASFVGFGLGLLGKRTHSIS